MTTVDFSGPGGQPKKSESAAFAVKYTKGKTTLSKPSVTPHRKEERRMVLEKNPKKF